MKRIFIYLLLTAAAVQAVQAQTKKIVADKIVAQVGDKIILKSDIVNAIADAKRQNAAYVLTECELLESLLIQKALVLQSQKDSLPIDDARIDGDLDNRFRWMISQYGSQQALEEIAGKSIYQMKEDFRASIREGQQADNMRRKIMETVKVSPVEAKAYFDKIPKDSLPLYESELELSQIVVYPKANTEVEEYVTQQLLDMKKQIESGAKTMESLAKLYSDDPGVSENKGRYNLNRGDKGGWDPTFLAAAFKLKEGQVSNVIKSKFGLHILQLISRTGDDAVVCHILRIPSVTEDEITDSKKHLDSLRAKIIAGNTTFGEAVKFSEDEAAKYTGGVVSAKNGSNFVTIDQLDKDMVVALKKMKIGEVSEPQSFTDERGKKAVRIIYLKSRTDPHRENMKDDYNKIADRVLEMKREEAMHKWFSDHISTYFIRIDSDYNNCNNIGQWREAAMKH